MECIAKYVRNPHFEKGAWITERTLEIYPDEDPINPRDPKWQDNFGHMVCFHSRYSLGDENDLRPEDFNGWKDIENFLKKKKKAVIVLPLYLFDHGGITIRTNPSQFRAVDSMGWDWGKVGFIYCTRSDIKETYGKVTTESLMMAESLLEAEVKEYDKYLTGEVYGFILTEDGEEIDSCWGFYGGIEQILEEVGMKDANNIG